RGFHETLRCDLRGTGVASTMLVPSKVLSGYFAHNPGAETGIPRISAIIGTLTPEQVADAIVRTIRSPRPLVFIPRRLGAAVRFGRVLPELMQRVVVATGVPRPAIAPGGSGS